MQTRARLLPVLGEVTILSTQLSMQGDARLREASQQVASAARPLLEDALDRNGFEEHADKMGAALKELYQARDVAASRWPHLHRSSAHESN